MTAPAAYASRRVFVVTSAYYALTDADEADHRTIEQFVRCKRG
jgi:hypothetical protein